MKKHLSLLTAGLIALLAACSGDNIIALPEPVPLPEPDPVEGPILTKAGLKVQVLDQTNRSPLPGAKVTLLSTGEVQTTDADGSVLFKEVHVGSHGTQVELDGYASMVYTAPIEPNLSERVHIATVTFGTALLYPLNASLEGSLFYIGEYNDYTLADGAKVRLTINGGGILNTVYEATVAGGKYAFANLPPTGTGYNLQALQYEVTGGFTYAGISLPNPALVAGNKVIQTYRSAYATKIEVPFVVTKHNERIKSTDTVTFEFSAVVDLAKSKVVLTENVAAVKEWSADKKTLKLFPPAGTKWNSSFVVDLYDVYSVGGFFIGNSSNWTYEVFLEKQDLTNALQKPECVSINGVTSYCLSTGANTPIATSVTEIKIQWDYVPDADGYNIYARATRGTGNFIKLNNELHKTLEYTINSDHIVKLGVPAPYYEPFIANSVIDIILQAVRDKSGDYSETSLSEALKIPLTIRATQAAPGY